MEVSQGLGRERTAPSSGETVVKMLAQQSRGAPGIVGKGGAEAATGQAEVEAEMGSGA